MYVFAPDVCKDNPDFRDNNLLTCTYYQQINCSHEIMSEDFYYGVIFNCPLSCGLCAPSPDAGSPTGGSQVPYSEPKSATDETTVCLSSDSVQQDGKIAWYFGTIQTWDASTVYVDLGIYGEGKYKLADIREYRSAKRCSSIRPGTESSLHSHPTGPSSLARIKRTPLLRLFPPFFVSCCLQLPIHTRARNSTRAGGGASFTAGCIPVPAGQSCSARGSDRERHVRGRCAMPSIRHVPRRQLVP
jgi:hypothetical protein